MPNKVIYCTELGACIQFYGILSLFPGDGILSSSVIAAAAAGEVKQSWSPAAGSSLTCDNAVAP